MKRSIDIRVLKGVVVLLVILLVILGGLLVLQFWDRTQSEETVNETVGTASQEESRPQSPTIEREVTYYNGQAYALRDDLESYLVMGLDKFAGDEQANYLNNQQADFLLLFVFDKTAGECTTIQLNRDTMTEIRILGVTGQEAGSFTGQLALAHTYGSGQEDSCRNEVQAVSNLLYGVPIDHYLSLTMDGVALLNDMVGGVTVTVMDDFTGIDDTLVQGQEVTLTGQHALTYVRARGGLEDSTNLHRMERQRQYLGGLFEKLSQQVKSNSGFTMDALLKVNEYMVSDCTINQLSEFADKVSDYGIGEIRTIPGESVKGEEYMEYYVDEDALQALVMDVFYETVDVE